MKGVLIKWSKTGKSENKEKRRVAVRNAQRSLRQQTRKQLSVITNAASAEDTPEELHSFEQPRVRLWYFD